MMRNVTAVHRLVACALALCLSVPAFTASAFAVTSEELFAEAESIMREIDALQTNINEETERYDAALAAHDEAEQAAAEAKERAEQERLRMQMYQEQLAELAKSMYKKGGSNSVLEVIVGSATFEEFLTSWDALNAVSSQGANLVQEAKDARALEEQARKEHEEQASVALQKMAEAEDARKKIEENQQALREEAEKITEEAAELQAQEELEKEAARQAAIAAEQARAAQEGQVQFTTGSTAVVGNGYFTHPLPSATISSPFGWRSFNGGSFHKGLDLAAAQGTPYYAADSGTVIYATYDGGYNGGAGNWIVIAHGNGLVTKYMHSSAVYVQVGEQVERGQVIGAVGNTGESFGPHLHFQVEYDGVAVDPLTFL